MLALVVIVNLAMILVTVVTEQYLGHHDDLGEDCVEDLGDDHDDDNHGDDTGKRQYQGTPATKKRDKWSPSCDSGRRISVFILIY